MSIFNVSPQKQKELEDRMQKLGLREKDFEEKFIKGSGKGGQKVNKTSSCVYLKHTLSGIEVKCQAYRSLALNRFIARRELCDKLDELLSCKDGVLGKKSEKQKEIEKVRKQKHRRERRRKDDE